MTPNAPTPDAGPTPVSDPSAPLELPPRSGVYRLGIFGSMMNPPHLGHLAAIEGALKSCALDRVEVVPAGLPPHRRAPRVSARDRLRLAILAFADHERIVVSDSEVERGEDGITGYMIDTIREVIGLPEELGFSELTVEPTLIIGADQAAHFFEWRSWQELLQLARIAIVPRPDHGPRDLSDVIKKLEVAGAAVTLVAMDPVSVSSHLVREAAQNGDTARLRELVAPSVVDDVVRLYGSQVKA